MWHSACGLLLLLFCSHATHSQEIGEPFRVDLAEGSTTVALDFSDRDYQLILYSTRTDAEPGPWGLRSPFGFSVTAAYGDSQPAVARHPVEIPSASLPNGMSLKSKLREQEQELARRLQASGGFRPYAAKAVPQEIGSNRKFVFPGYACQIIDEDTTITAVLVATSQRAIAYVDIADISRVSKVQIQAHIDRFSRKTYPILTSTFGDGSDVDNDGKIHFLYTHLMDPDPDVIFASKAGMFDALALLPASQGGNGNRSDMFYVNPGLEPRKFDAVIAHEFQHLINFNQRVLVRKGNSEHIWLNEGLSHVAEDLIGENDKTNHRWIGNFLDNTHSGALGALSSPNSYRRGAAYMFLRSAVEEFGSGVLTRLVQTQRTGISNVENVIGQPIADIFERHVLRLFLSGLGLNARFNYTTPPLADNISQGRAFPLPEEHIVWPEGGYQHDGYNDAVKPDSSGGLTINGFVYQLSSAYVRIVGDGGRIPLTITVDPKGETRAQFIPIPKNWRPRLDVPRGYTPKARFEPPLPVQFRTGEGIRISGTVSDSSISNAVKLHFEHDEWEKVILATVTNGRFSKNISFTSRETGEVFLNLGVRQNGVTYISEYFRRITVVEGDPPSPDFDRDGAVVFPDFIAFASAFGATSSDEDFDPTFDLDEDGEIGFSDFLIFSKAFGSQVGS